MNNDSKTIGGESHADDILLTNIQRFSLHDGPGIRTTVFLKGCGLHCPWCSNPENINCEIQEYIKDGAGGVFGKWYTPMEVYEEIVKDRAFYEGVLTSEHWSVAECSRIDRLPGGVTFSGGEPLLQMKKLVPLLKRLKDENIHMAVETSLYAPENDVRIALQYIDFFYVDIKILDPITVHDVLQGNLDIYLDNLECVLRWTGINDYHKPVIIRVPVIGSYTDTRDNRMAVKRLLQRYKDMNLSPLKIELVKEHNLGISKYKSLGQKVPEYKGVSDEIMDEYKWELEQIGIEVEVCRV